MKNTKLIHQDDAPLAMMMVHAPPHAGGWRTKKHEPQLEHENKSDAKSRSTMFKLSSRQGFREASIPLQPRMKSSFFAAGLSGNKAYIAFTQTCGSTEPSL